MPGARSHDVIPLLISMTAMLGACAVGPHYQGPKAPPAAGFSPTPLPELSSSAEIPGGTAQHFIGGRDIPFEWWELFQSTTLNSLIERAFEANPSIAAAQATLRQARELIAAQRGFFYPSLGASQAAERHKVSGNTNSSSTIGVQANGVNLLPGIPEIYPNAPPHNQPSYYTFYTAQLSVGFVPDVFGANRRQVESFAAQADARRFALEAAYITLASDVVAAVIQEASIRAEIRATRQIIEAGRQSLQIRNDQSRLGYATRLDVAAQEATLAEETATLPPLEKLLEQTRDLLRVLVGSLPNRETDDLELEALQLPPEVPISLPAKLIEQRPDVRAAAAQLRASNAAIGVAVAAMLPQVSIDGEYGGNATRVTQMFSAGGPFWNLYGHLTQPVFEGGSLLHQERAARETFKQVAAQYQNTVLIAYQNVADTLHESLSDADALSADVEAERSARLAYELTRAQMQSGFVGRLALLNAETTYRQTLLVRVQAQATRYGDTVALFQALGGGWWNRHEFAGS